MRFEHAGLSRGFVGAVFKNIPAAKNQVVKTGEGDEIFDLWRIAVSAFAQANGAHLCERTYGIGFLFAHQFHASHKRGGDRAHTRQQNAEFPFRRDDLAWLFHEYPRLFQLVEVPGTQQFVTKLCSKLSILLEASAICKRKGAIARTGRLPELTEIAKFSFRF